MSFDFDNIAVDANKAREGVWVEYMGGRFKIARFTNPEADMARKEVQMRHYAKLQEALKDGKDTIDMEEYQKEMAFVMAEHILLGWEGVGRGGKELEYSVENAAEVLSNPNLYEFYQFVLERSVSHDNYRLDTEQVVEDVKTSAEA